MPGLAVLMPPGRHPVPPPSLLRPSSVVPPLLLRSSSDRGTEEGRRSNGGTTEEPRQTEGVWRGGNKTRVVSNGPGCLRLRCWRRPARPVEAAWRARREASALRLMQCQGGHVTNAPRPVPAACWRCRDRKNGTLPALCFRPVTPRPAVLILRREQNWFAAHHLHHWHRYRRWQNLADRIAASPPAATRPPRAGHKALLFRQRS